MVSLRPNYFLFIGYLKTGGGEGGGQGLGSSEPPEPHWIRRCNHKVTYNTSNHNTTRHILSKATSSLFLGERVAKLKETISTELQNKDQTQPPEAYIESNNKQQQQRQNRQQQSSPGFYCTNLLPSFCCCQNTKNV